MINESKYFDQATVEALPLKERAARQLEARLGFKISSHTIEFTRSGGVRPANAPEIFMWNALLEIEEECITNSESPERTFKNSWPVAYALRQEREKRENAAMARKNRYA